MQINLPITFQKTQTKANDCWYACIQMIKSAKAGAKTKTAGNSAQTHRAKSILGKTLGFDSPLGQQVMADNGLKNVNMSVRLDDITSLYTALQAHGPMIAGGQYGIFNTQGHFIVISGVDTVSGEVTIYDPFWVHGKARKSWNYITKHIWKSGNNPDDHALIACQ